jgi:ankyrin repeat protein
MAEILLEAGADVNLKTKDGQSALVIAAAAGDESCVELLLKAGADPDDTDALGASARKYAALFHNEAIVNLFNTYAPVKAG